MPRRDSNPHFIVVDDHHTAYKMSNWSMGFLLLSGVY
jgi:hypothetical protein